jgi:hypothetical protein
VADRYLLESGAPDGYLLEDGTGVLLIEHDTILARFSTTVVPPQQTAVQEVAGYALVFGSFFLANVPLQDPIAAAEYTVGTHRAAYHEAQPRPRVWGTTPALVVDTIGAAQYSVGGNAYRAASAAQPLPNVWGTSPALIPAVSASEIVGRTIVIVPQQYADLVAYIHGTAPDSVAGVVNPVIRTIVVPEQSYENIRPLVHGVAPDSVPRPLLRTIVSAPLQLDYPYGLVWGPQPPSIGTTVVVGLVTETDSTFAPGKAKQKTVGLVDETDSVLLAVANKSRLIGLNTETDSTFALTFTKLRQIGLLTETDSVFAVITAKAKAIGLNTETDSVFPLGKSKVRSVGLNLEVDSALAVTVIGGTPPGGTARKSLYTQLIRLFQNILRSKRG